MDEDREPGVLDALWRFRWSSAAIVLFVVAVSVSVGLLAQPKAQAKATILLATPPENSVLTPSIQGDSSLARYTAQRAAFVTSDQMLDAVAANLAAPTTAKAGVAANGAPATTVPIRHTDTRSFTDLRHDLTAAPSSTSNAIVITARGNSADDAVRLADAAVAAYRSETAKEVADLTNAAVRSIQDSETSVRQDAALEFGRVEQRGREHLEPAGDPGERIANQPCAVRRRRRVRRRRPERCGHAAVTPHSGSRTRLRARPRDRGHRRVAPIRRRVRRPRLQPARCVCAAQHVEQQRHVAVIGRRTRVRDTPTPQPVRTSTTRPERPERSCA